MEKTIVYKIQTLGEFCFFHPDLSAIGWEESGHCAREMQQCVPQVIAHKLQPEFGVNMTVVYRLPLHSTVRGMRYIPYIRYAICFFSRAIPDVMCRKHIGMYVAHSVDWWATIDRLVQSVHKNTNSIYFSLY